MTYAEALYDEKQEKGDRNEVESRQALGVHDSFFPDGGAQRTFEPLWWRLWRYLDLDIQTAGEPLAEFTAYPFEERASFDGKDPDLARIWEISWRTAPRRARDLHGYCLLETVTVCWRYPDSGLDLVCRCRRRPAGQAGAREL